MRIKFINTKLLLENLQNLDNALARIKIPDDKQKTGFPFISKLLSFAFNHGWFVLPFEPDELTPFFEKFFWQNNNDAKSEKLNQYKIIINSLNNVQFIIELCKIQRIYIAIRQIQRNFMQTFDAYNCSNDRIRVIVLNWLITRFIQNYILPEDVGFNSKATEYFKKFFKINNRLPKKDINQYQSLAEIYTAIKDINPVTKINPHTIPNTKILYEDNESLIVQPLTVQASCALGKNTEWCTSKYPPDDYRNKFDYYNDRDPLFVVLNKQSGQRFLYFQPENQLKNEDDQDPTTEEQQWCLDVLSHILTANPQFKHPFFKNPIFLPHIKELFIVYDIPLNEQPKLYSLLIFLMMKRIEHINQSNPGKININDPNFFNSPDLIDQIPVQFLDSLRVIQSKSILL